MARPSTPSSIEVKNKETRIRESHENAILGKRENPSWRQLMNCSSCFDGIVKGYWNLINNEWAVIMTDAIYGHQLLCKYLSNHVGVMKTISRDNMFDSRTFEEPVNWIAFECDVKHHNHIIVRDVYVEDKYDSVTQLSDEKREAIKYRIKTNILPLINSILDDSFPYHETPRIMTSLTNYESTLCGLEELYKSEYYHYDGDRMLFRDLVDKLHGKSIFESDEEFKRWLDED